ncbi:Uncharacterized conserved protein, DUF58 family, contains vWF domain [Pedococcus dokdonensis]|uniref:Uncharacterized conserved protein, DUF58 family, contains vWF domain n=1 Tax=Pedococcus dokdonensis TaxID=443156 RepID=A0A1H0QEG2_9MICO|nr:DUF58 domain-containing protein [Pedococcus dokdonensis]SDP15580.1 Uncharacterized conserved protein, DUF58 family, contains vWF domain [Pedococcus dokdonensis]
MTTTPGRRLEARWRVTSAHLRAMFLGLLLASIAVVMRRPDALVIGAPLLVIGLWATATRPTVPPVVVARVAHPLLREGQATRWTATVTPGPGLEEAGLALLPTPHTEFTPGHRTAAIGLTPHDQPQTLEVVVRSTRWGRRPLGPATLAVSGAFGAFRWEPEAVALPAIPTVPLPDSFAARVPVPHPDGLVGQNRSHHQGSGGELDQIRPFRFGDRLRRVHWPVSVRTGELHVTATHADQDTEILLLVDAMHDIGQSTGVDGSSSSLDNAVRAAGAIAEHYLRTGDRVGLLVLGSRDTPLVTAAAGSNHLRRLLDVLARVTVADGTVSDEKRLRSQLRHHVSAGTLAIILTPAVSPEVLAHAVALARRGISVVTVDTLPPGLAAPDIPAESLAQLASTADDLPTETRLAWRLRLLERQREMTRAREAGVPIVPWAGPGTLDLVLRDLGRRSRAPRVVSR